MEVLRQHPALTQEQKSQDIGTLLTALIQEATLEDKPKLSLEEIYDVVKDTDLISEMEPLTLLPNLLLSPKQGAISIIRLIGELCSPKEVIIAVQENMERLEAHLLADEAENGEDTLLPAKQIDRLLVLYAVSIPRLRKGKKPPSGMIRPLLAELESVISLSSTGTSEDDGQQLIKSVSHTVTAIYGWVNAVSPDDNDESKSVALSLYALLTSTLVSCANSIKVNLAQQAYRVNFPRLQFRAPGASTESESSHRRDVVQDALDALTSIGIDLYQCQSQPSLGSLILIAHTADPTLSIPVLIPFLPVFISSLQSNAALDESIAILVSSLVPLQSHSPRPELPPEFAIPLVQVLSPLASSHPDAFTRNTTFRLLSVVLSLIPAPLRLQLLQDLLVNSDVSFPQMRVAAVGLAKDAVLEALSTASTAAPNVFASPMFLRTLGPVLFRPDPPDLFGSSALTASDFLETPEPLRLVECLALCFVLVQRDTRNMTGVRDADMLKNIERSLLDPLSKQLAVWNTGDNTSIHDDTMKLEILGMWAERTRAAIEGVRYSEFR